MIIRCQISPLLFVGKALTAITVFYLRFICLYNVYLYLQKVQFKDVYESIFSMLACAAAKRAIGTR